MSYEREGVYLLKRWSREKGVDHYAVGLGGTATWRAGYHRASTVQLLPTGIHVELWTERDGWEILLRAGDAAAALARLGRLSSQRYALLDSNCEHFAREVVTGVRESRQVQGAVLIGALAALVVACR
jgi:hypothetical protein